MHQANFCSKICIFVYLIFLCYFFIYSIRCFEFFKICPAFDQHNLFYFPCEEYILSQPEEVRIYLRQVNEAIKAGIPEAKEKISWSMPTYWKGRNLIQFAASKRHIGLYPGAEAVEAFAGRLTDYKTSKGTIQLPYSKPLPLELIADIAKWCGENS